MAVNKYLGSTGLTELINLIQADFQKKQDWMQFPEMPAATNYTGKVVQFTGATDANFTKGFFYYSTGLEWTMVSVASAFEVVTVLPAWAAAGENIIYFMLEDGKLIGNIKNPAVTGAWYTIGSETIGSETTKIEYLDALPAYADAKIDTLYVVNESGILNLYTKAPANGKFNVLLGHEGIPINDIDNVFNEIFN